jgi:hypothetical protein
MQVISVSWADMKKVLKGHYYTQATRNTDDNVRRHFGEIDIPEG